MSRHDARHRFKPSRESRRVNEWLQAPDLASATPMVRERVLSLLDHSTFDEAIEYAAARIRRYPASRSFWQQVYAILCKLKTSRTS